MELSNHRWRLNLTLLWVLQAMNSQKETQCYQEGDDNRGKDEWIKPTE